MQFQESNPVRSSGAKLSLLGCPKLEQGDQAFEPQCRLATERGLSLDKDMALGEATVQPT